MKIIKMVFSAVVMLSFLSACSSSDDSSANSDAMSDVLLAEGMTVTLRNTLEEGGPEGAFPTLFGLEEDAYDETGTVSFFASEFPTALAQPGSPVGDISGLYDIDINMDTISFTLLPATDDPFWTNIFGVFPAGKFDRYYMTFSSPHGITSGTSSNSSVGLRVDSDSVIVVEIGENYDMNPGISFRIDIQ